MTDELKQIEAYIASEVETWVREELSTLVVLEIAKLNERLRKETITHLRATLLPKLTKHIDEQIKKLGPRE